jgi:outer membrane receptor protein involved in Fe transport
MKTLFTFLAVACSVVLMAQGNSKISGVVNDSTSNKPVEFATVALIDGTGKAVDGAICDDKGEFIINKVPRGSYKLAISFIGFDTKTISLKVEDKNVEIGTVTISPTAQVLKEVTVEGQRALIEERVDRTIYNAENDATTRGGDATDVLKRVPMLSVDLDGNVSLRGNQNIMVLINNKPSTIVASSVADALKQIPADQIKTVEVITSPSAKYDAEGSAGIINIVTKKNAIEGMTLNINAGVGTRGSNLGLNGNYRKGKMGFSLGGWGRSTYNVKGEYENRQSVFIPEITDGTNTIPAHTQYTVQSANSRNQGLFGNYNLGWDYDINEKNSLAASVRFGVRNGENRQNDLSRYVNDALTSLSNTVSDDQSNNVDASLTYTHLYKKPQRELSFQGQYSRNNRQNVVENFYLDLDEFFVDNRLKNLNDSYNQEMTIQFDYQTPILDNQMLEFGAKNIMRSAVSDFTTFNASGQGEPYIPSTDASRSNNLNYDQNVTAGYLSYTLSLKNGYSFKAGSRYEYATIDAYTRTEADIKIPSYSIVVPSLNVSKRLSNGKMIKASYNRRIQRPSIRFLNPNKQYSSDTINYTIGNPELDPEFTNNYELSYSTFVKGTSLNISGFVRNTNDAIQSIKTRDEDGFIATRYANIGLENAYGVSVFANVMVGNLTLNGGGDVYYAVLDNNNPVDTLRLKNEGLVMSGRFFGNYDFTKGWGLQFFSFIRGGQINLQGSQRGFYNYSLAIKKDINEKRGSISLGAENFLQPYFKMENRVESPGISQITVNKMYNMSFRINFSYRIGKMSMDGGSGGRQRGGWGGGGNGGGGRGERRSINNDDLKQGGDNNMDSGQMEGGNTGGTQRGGGNFPGGGGQRPQTPQQNSPAPVQNNIPKPADGEIFEAAGTWTYTTNSPQGGGGTIVIRKENDAYSGTIKTDRMPQATALSSVVVKGNELTISYTVSFGGNSVPVEIKSTFNNTDMQGTMAFGQFRTVNITAKKAQ